MLTQQGSHCPAVSASPEALQWRLQHFKPLLMKSTVPLNASLLPCCLFPILFPIKMHPLLPLRCRPSLTHPLLHLVSSCRDPPCAA